MAVPRIQKSQFKKIELKWQKRWADEKVFEVKQSSKKKFYVLEMFPYPSGSGLHMGHAFNYTVGDIHARMKRMQGLNVLYPMGFDSFGLPAENAAIKEKIHPKQYMNSVVKNYTKQMKNLGLSYDWSRTLKTSDPEYYKWNQYFFLKFYERGLVHRKKSEVNWCPECNTVLANEQVHNGKCWRHPDTEVRIKLLEQWFIKTTNYAEELLENIPQLDWPQRIKTMQENWIGRSEGTEILFKVNGENWPIFTTRPDTLFGVTFMVIAAQHSKLSEIVTEDHKSEVDNFLKKIRSTKQEDLDKLDKDGVFTGSYATHPLTNKKIPIYAGNFVIADYGSGMVMAVPAHDQRDFEFAKKYNLQINEVVKGGNIKKEAFTGAGVLINSEGFNDLSPREAKTHITNALKSKKLGKKTIQYKLRDWLISRQRYWGTPIPMIYCEQCGIVPVNENDLPIKLPDKVKFGEGNPLESNKNFVNTSCPKCKSKAKRETDTMDTFFDSSWYYLRYLDNKNSKVPFEKSKAKYWMPIDQYIGGAEHAVMHLIYARFFTKALRDLGFLNFDEPFTKLFNQGMLHKSGSVMSKSKGNVVLPEEVSEKYGIDTARLFLVSIASPEKDIEWSESGIEGTSRFINKIMVSISNIKIGKSSEKAEHAINSAIKKITQYISDFKYNYAVITLRGMLENLPLELSKKDLESIIKLMAPFCPHISEELWEKIGNKPFISLASWPSVDPKKINQKFEQADKLMEKTLQDIMNILKIVKGKAVYIYTIPPELDQLDSSALTIRAGRPVKIFAVNDKAKHDPQGKAKKAKPGKPAIYVE